MKRFILILFFGLLGLSVFAQEVIKEDSAFVAAANSTDDQVVGQVIREDRASDFNHWSISLGGGFNLLLTERYGSRENPAQNYVNNFNGGGYFNFGYMINPIWGVYAEYGYMQINKKIATKAGDFEASGHEVTLQLDFNILNLVRKCRKNTKWNVDALVGAGVLLYNSSPTYTDENGDIKHYFYPAICIPVSLKIQYCPINELGIALRMTGKWHSEDNINYIPRSAGGENHNNDLALYAGIELQYNITTPGKSHVRVTDRCTYEPMNVVLESKILEVNKHTEQISDIEDDLEDVKDDISVLNGTADPEVVRARREARKAMKQQPNQGDVAQVTPVAATNNGGNAGDKGYPVNPGTVGDGGNVVYAPVDMSKYDKLADDVDKMKGDIDNMKDDIERLRQQIMMSNGTDEYTVYFDFDKYDVKPEYQLVIAKVARAMLRDKDLNIDLVSHCDKAGTVAYNQPLGRNRAQIVRDILVNQYKIEKSRINIRYDGQIFDEFDAVNRRCDIIFK